MIYSKIDGLSLTKSELCNETYCVLVSRDIGLDTN